MSLHRYNPKRDQNEADIVNFFRKSGFTVERLSGKNVPDLLLGKHGFNFLVEVKMPNQDLNAGQKLWHDSWRGQTKVIKSIEDAQNFIYNELFTCSQDKYHAYESTFKDPSFSEEKL